VPGRGQGRAGAHRGEERLISLHAAMVAARADELANITRLRLLSSPRVMDAAFRLRDAESRYITLAFNFDEVLGPEADKQLHDTIRAARDDVVAEAKREMAIS
jgi:hypothetical protein